MIYKNIELHNVGKIIEDAVTGNIRWLRVPENVYENMDSEQGKNKCRGCTGVELRFVMKSETVTIRMHTTGGEGVFHIYRGSIQGGWEDNTVCKTVGTDIKDFVIKKSQNIPVLKRITSDFKYPFSPEVIRVIFDRGSYEIVDIVGDIEPPKKEQIPSKMLLVYGSSITHGSNALDMSHSWASILAHKLKMDVINLGMAGSCLLEPEIVKYIASEGEKGIWDMAILELGINALDWDEIKIRHRVENTVKMIVDKNPQKYIFVMSPLYSIDDYKSEGKACKWRRIIEDVIKEKAYKNVIYINGIDILENMSFISADEVHPNIYGVSKIAEKMEHIVREKCMDFLNEGGEYVRTI